MSSASSAMVRCGWRQSGGETRTATGLAQTLDANFPFGSNYPTVTCSVSNLGSLEVAMASAGRMGVFRHRRGETRRGAHDDGHMLRGPQASPTCFRRFASRRQGCAGAC